jgi:hypothetical protein
MFKVYLLASLFALLGAGCMITKEKAPAEQDGAKAIDTSLEELEKTNPQRAAEIKYMIKQKESQTDNYGEPESVPQ